MYMREQERVLVGERACERACEREKERVERVLVGERACEREKERRERDRERNSVRECLWEREKERREREGVKSCVHITPAGNYPNHSPVCGHHVNNGRVTVHLFVVIITMAILWLSLWHSNNLMPSGHLLLL